MDAGCIQPSKASYGASVLFQRKKDRSLRICIDYWALNKVTIKNKYHVPLIADLFNQLGKARYFTKLDLRLGYYQLRIAKEDEAKTMCVTRYGSYEFLVMPFGLINAPVTFFILMNKLFHLFLDKFMVVYLDDIVVYSHTLEEHVLHLKHMFQVLRDNKLYVKLEKCSFAQDEFEFLGHKIKDVRLTMDGAKIKAIQDWESPTMVSELRSFLGLEPVLKLLNVTMPFKLHIDALDFAVGGFLMQDGHPIAFEIRKLNETERKYTMQEKEMTTGDLRRAILKEYHDSKWAGHPGITRTLALVERTYYWPRIGDDVETFEEGGSIIVVVDRFSKYGTFIAAPPDVTADDTAKLFFKNAVKYWGVPHVIVSDRDPRFIVRFWTELFKIMGAHLNFSMSFHPKRTDKRRGSSPTAYKTIKEWHEQADSTRASLDKAAKKMKKWANERRRHVEFERYEGPFSVIGRVGTVSYRVQLPPKLKIHLVFYVSFLKPYREDEEDPRRGVSKRAPTAVVTLYDQEVEEILLDRTIRRRGVPSYKEYLIKWRDLPNSEASWEAKDLLWQLCTRSRHITKMARQGRHELRWEKVLEALGSPWKLMEDLEAS
nr:hypothetical protein VITISV_020909 [Tanacetum cinerariifolium]